MYTQCPNCDTVFDVTDEDLGMRQGRVRCGRCREAFNAPWNLVGPLSGNEQSGSVISVAGPPEKDLSAGEDDPTVVGSDAVLMSAPGVPPEDESDILQSWTVSELNDGSAASALEGRPGSMDEVITETLTLTEIATTEEVEMLGDQAAGLPPLMQVESGTDIPDAAIPTDIDEEIVIEAPINLWNVTEEREENGLESGARADERAVLPPLKKTGPRMVPVARHADDVKLVQIPHPKPIQTVAWGLASLFLVAAIFWQLKQYYISELAEVASLREPLVTICEYASCTVPPRTDIKRIDLVGTNVDPHPATPGALRVSANLINRAKFAQPFPPLEVTLTDKEGAVVGRRTYLPHEYRSAPPGGMLPNVLERADLDLAQPAHSAVGYEIQLVAG